MNHKQIRFILAFLPIWIIAADAPVYEIKSSANMPWFVHTSNDWQWTE